MSDSQIVSPAGSASESEADPATAQRQRKIKSKRRARKPQPAARARSKKAAVITMLKRPKGATLQDLVKATDWQAHSVRGFISGSLVKKMGLQVISNKRPDGQRAYRLKKLSGHPRGEALGVIPGALPCSS